MKQLTITVTDNLFKELKILSRDKGINVSDLIKILLWKKLGGILQS